ncbi:MAG: Nramp family divalent metal transporter [Myxococcales bacterium]|nr:Nramp family divalent metal transporter [Myxococcales bacterium]
MIHLSERVLPAPRRASLPEAPPLRRMLGPSIILLGLSIGSGEFVLWPKLTAEWGFGLFWACWLGATMQFFIDMEVERYTLATGESAVVGFVRASRAWGPVFLACGIVPWIWPGWATGAGVLLSWEIGGPPVLYAVVGLVGCGVALTLSPVVYRFVEVVQTVLVVTIFALVLLLAALVVRGDSLAALFDGALRFGWVPDGIHLPALLGALAFAGAGGTVNLAQSNYIKDKGYGMGCYIGRITSPLTGREEAESTVGYAFEDDASARARWATWWRRANVEHFFSFYVLCVLSLALFCLLTHALIGSGRIGGGDFDFIAAQGDALAARFGAWAEHAFFAAGFAVLFSTELAVLDAVTRVVADLVKVVALRDREDWTMTRVYFAVLWMFVAFGVLVIALGMQRPLQLLVLSAALNAVVMFLYSGLLLWVNWTSFSPPLRPGPLRVAALLGAFAFFGYFSVVTLVEEAPKLVR